MKQLRTFLALAALAWLAPRVCAAELQSRSWQVDGVTRHALVSVPAGFRAGRGLAGRVRLSRSWRLDEPGFAQFSNSSGLARGNRHLSAGPADAQPAGRSRRPLAGLAGNGRRAGRSRPEILRQNARGPARRFPIDEKRIYATGHSNGGLFTYLLWAERGEVLAAVAPSAALLARGFQKLQPKPVLHLGSPEDPLVKFAWQSRMIDYVLRVNGCGPRQAEAMGYNSYPSSKGTEVATYLHTGGHRFPPDGAEQIVKFFQSHPRS